MDIKQYWKEIATKSGIDAEKLGQVEALLADPGLAKVFTDGFKPLPDYSRDLDSVRTRTAAEEKARFEDWYKKTVADPWAEIQARNAKYKELYGDLDEAHQQQQRQHPNPNGNTPHLTIEQIQELLDKRLAENNTKVVHFASIRDQHLTTFRKPLDTGAFEKAWQDHPEWGNSMQMAYEKFIEPQMSEIRKAEENERIEKLVSERLAEAASRQGVPLHSGPKAFSPLMDYKTDVSKLSEQEQYAHSKNAFMKDYMAELGKAGS